MNTEISTVKRLMNEAETAWAAMPVRKCYLNAELEAIFVENYVRGVLNFHERFADDSGLNRPGARPG